MIITLKVTHPKDLETDWFKIEAESAEDAVQNVHMQRSKWNSGSIVMVRANDGCMEEHCFLKFSIKDDEKPLLSRVIRRRIYRKGGVRVETEEQRTARLFKDAAKALEVPVENLYPDEDNWIGASENWI